MYNIHIRNTGVRNTIYFSTIILCVCPSMPCLTTGWVPLALLQHFLRKGLAGWMSPPIWFNTSFWLTSSEFKPRRLISWDQIYDEQERLFVQAEQLELLEIMIESWCSSGGPCLENMLCGAFQLSWGVCRKIICLKSKDCKIYNLQLACRAISMERKQNPNSHLKILSILGWKR